MKKLVTLSILLVAIHAGISAQSGEGSIKQEIKKSKKEISIIKKEKRFERKELRKLEGVNVSEASKQAFYTDFGDIPVKSWKRTDYFDEAEFTKGGQMIKAYYDENAKLVGTTTHVKFSDLPVSAQKEINETYAGYTKKEVIFFNDNEAHDTDMFLYNQQFDDEDNYFVVLQKGTDKLVVHANTDGAVDFFTQISK